LSFAKQDGSPILYRFFYLLTPPSELPVLPKAVSSYIAIHTYTVSQIVLTTIIFIVTLTKAGPIFPIIIIALVPVRLGVMNRMWNRETLRYVDAWACRDGTPEDDEDRKKGLSPSAGAAGSEGSIELGPMHGTRTAVSDTGTSSAVQVEDKV
jgi:hypothetical protein